MHHCCSEKETNIAYSGCVFVDLVIHNVAIEHGIML